MYSTVQYKPHSIMFAHFRPLNSVNNNKILLCIEAIDACSCH